MKVYVVCHDYGHEGMSEPIAAFATYDAAKAFTIMRVASGYRSHRELHSDEQIASWDYAITEVELTES